MTLGESLICLSMLAAAIQLIKKNFYFLAGKSIPFEYLVCALRLVIYFVTFQISLQNLNCKISEFFFVVLNPEVVQHFSTLLFYVPHSYNTHFLAVCDLGNFINISLKIVFHIIRSMIPVQQKYTFT